VMSAYGGGPRESSANRPTPGFYRRVPCARRLAAEGGNQSGPGRTDFRLRLLTGAHTALAGKTRALADLRKTPAGRRRTLTSCNHMRIGETEVLFRASSRP